jgi:UDP-N-acetylmuramate dehydrogenase
MERISDANLAELSDICPGGIEQNVSLAQISKWGIGGNADLVIRPSTSQQLADLHSWFYRNKIHHLTFGSTSNLLFSDDGLRAPCIQLGNRLSQVNISRNTVCAQAGVWVPNLARRLMQAELTGGEHMCGIPGTLGGLVCMNGGSHRKSISSNVESVESVGATGEIVLRRVSECNFSYRSSIFQANNEVITSVTLKFNDGQRTQIRHDMLAILAERSRKFPRKLPNCGSVFKSSPAMYAEIGPPGEVIEKLGFKGKQLGGALVSPKHANFIVNTGGATASDVLKLIAKISRKVLDSTGYYMEPEALHVTTDGRIVLADSVLK